LIVGVTYLEDSSTSCEKFGCIIADSRIRKNLRPWDILACQLCVKDPNYGGLPTTKPFSTK